MISEKSELSKISKLTRKGYSIKKSQIHPNLYIELIESLKVSPVVHKDYAKFAETFYVFCENKSKIYLPKFWAIKNLGPPNIINLKEGDKININCKYQPLPFQGPIIKEIYDKILSEGGTILSVACGMGKTFMSLYISSKLGFKTLVVVHTSVLLSQWIDRINQFLPNARVGIIRGNKFDSEDKDICIAMLQTLVSPQRIFKSDAFNSFGFLIVDECHRIAAPTFSRALPRITTKYMLGLSATPNRPDKLEKVFKWYLGDIGVFKKREDGFLIVKYIKYTNDNYREIRRSWNNSYDLVKMVELIIKCKERNNFIVKQAIKFAQTGRQILILSSRRQHLKNMEKLIKNYKNTEIKEILEKMFPYETVIHNNIMKFYEMDITCGLYIGQMKPSELEISSKCNIILGTYSLVSEGTDIPTLNTLIMASPKKSIEQVVGRILRAETGFTPLVLDMCDDFSVYTNQGRARQKFYNSNDYHIDTFTKHNNEPLMYNKEEIFITDEKQTCGVIKKQRGRRKNTKKKQEKPKKQSKCLIDISDSD
jgi:superfamily II DNA or RNA helicase